MQLSSTETHIDRMKASKELADDNALKIQQKEQLEREIDTLVLAKEDIIRKSGYTPAEYKIVEDEHLSNVEDTEDRAVRARIELEKLDKTISDRSANMTHIATTVSDLEAKSVVLTHDIGILETRKQNAESASAEAIRKYTALITDKSNEITSLTSRGEKIKGDSNTISKDLTARLASVVEQERIASIRRTDLEIYEARLRAKYPNDSIIL